MSKPKKQNIILYIKSSVLYKEPTGFLYRTKQKTVTCQKNRYAYKQVLHNVYKNGGSVSPFELQKVHLLNEVIEHYCINYIDEDESPF